MPMAHAQRHACLLAAAAIFAAGAASADVYRVKVQFHWDRSGSEAPPRASPGLDQVFLVECSQSPAGRDLDWIERNCTPVSSVGIQFNPTEITISKPVRAPTGG